MKEFKCIVCGNIKTVWDSEFKRSHPRFCSHKCRSKGTTKALIEFSCIGCGKKSLMRAYKPKQYCSHACFLKNGSVLPKLTGEKHYLWKGGNNPVKRNYTLNKKWRKAVLERDGYRCVYCGSTKSLEIDHLWPISIAPELATDIDNGQTLCRECHRKTFTWGTSNTRFIRMIKESLKGKDLKKIFSFEEIIHTFEEMKKNGEI